MQIGRRGKPRRGALRQAAKRDWCWTEKWNVCAHRAATPPTVLAGLCPIALRRGLPRRAMAKTIGGYASEWRRSGEEKEISPARQASPQCIAASRGKLICEP